ncbi:MAG: pentapeptide repeat-containing protein [Candidatus Nanopelagicales bacterium]
MSIGAGRTRLQADCSRCFGLCCIALTLTASADFAIDKPAGQPCPNLQPDYRCGVHQSLRENGFRGCTVYDCFGAGQQVSQGTYGGKSWGQASETATQMFDAFAVMRQLHELLWYLTEALELPAARVMADELRRVLRTTEALTGLDADALVVLDLTSHKEQVGAILRRVSDLVRAGTPGREVSADGKKLQSRMPDLIGADLRGADLRGISLRGALLVAADLRRADLRLADLIGADLRDADLCGADLTGALFLTQAQLDAAKGDAVTNLPSGLTRPTHWETRTDGAGDHRRLTRRLRRDVDKKQ